MRRRPVFARAYAWLSRRIEPELAGYRRQLLHGLTGRIVEIGAGNGLNFAHYPAGVTSVLAVEPEPHLRRLAQQSATSADVDVQVVEGVAEKLPAENGDFDAAVTSLVLCSVPNPQAALAEIHRVLRPGGELRFLEHVRADSARLRRIQRLLDATVWPAVAGGGHTGRDTVGAIEDAGFAIRRLERFRFPDTRVPAPSAPHVLGTGRRP